MRDRPQLVLMVSSCICIEDAPLSDTSFTSVGKLSLYPDLVRISYFSPSCPKSLLINIKMFDIYNVMVLPLDEVLL